MAKKTESCDLNGTSRIDLFRHVAVDKVTNKVDSQILSMIADDQYDEFVNFCEQVTEEKNSIQDVSCAIVDGKLEFAINYKKNK